MIKVLVDECSLCCVHSDNSAAEYFILRQDFQGKKRITLMSL